MNTITRRARLLALVAATSISVIGAVATSATDASAYGVVQTDDVVINRVGFDIGGSGFANGAPTSPATLEWATAWFANIPTVSGNLHFEGVANNCARVRVTSFDDAGVELDPPNFSNQECVSGNGHFSRAFTVQADLGASSVEVTLQTALNVVNPVWGGIGSETYEYGPTVGTNDVLLSRAELDFGTGVFTNGAPPSAATLHWEVVDGYKIRPRAEGTLYMKNADDRCGRITLKYYSTLPNIGLIDTTYGDEHCVTDDDLHEFGINHFNPAIANPAIDKVKVVLETRPNGGVWETRGSAIFTLP